MMLFFQRLRQEEEGQTLVLGAIFGLILALCILGTVNLGRAVYEKTQVQTACDNGAYSQAAIEARVLNFTAYTNRSMVAHYASIMAASAYLTWIHYMYVFLKLGLDALKFLPYIGQVASVIDTIFKYVMIALDIGIAAITPIVSAANTVLWGLQEGAWLSVWGNRLSKIPPEAHSGDSNNDPYVPIWPNLIPAANMMVFSQTRGSRTILGAWADALKMLINSKDDNVQQARLHIIEIANSARTPWVAYGDEKINNPAKSPFARHWAWAGKVLGCQISFGVVARTEMGSYEPASGLSSPTKRFGQVFSGSRAQFSISNCLVSLNLSLFGMTTLDDALKTKSAEYFGGGGTGGGLIGLIIKAIFGSLGVFQAMPNYARNQAKVNPDMRIFWISPYVFFAPRAAAKPNGGLTSELGNFAQPDVFFGLAREGRDYNRQPGAGFFGRRFNFRFGGSGTGNTDFRYTAADWPRLPGMPNGLQFLHQGFNALCAAQVYYHRPGEWKEMPNFFNPLWGARLMPVTESNTFASLKLNSVPLIQQFLTH